MVDRLAVETQWLVKCEAMEYFGKVGTRQGVVVARPAARRSERDGALQGAGGAGPDRGPGLRGAARGVEVLGPAEGPHLDFGDEDGAADDEAAALFGG